MRPIGGQKEVAIDVRVVAATHRDLAAMVAEGRFRLDLFHRLNVLSVRLPPLRERRDEIAPLAEHFLTRYAPRWARTFIASSSGRWPCS